MKPKKSSISTAALVTEQEVQGFASIEAAQHALTIVVKAAENVANKWKDYAARLIALSADEKSVDAFLALDSTADAITAGMSENARVLLQQGRKAFSEALTTAKAEHKRRVDASKPEAEVEVAREAMVNAQDRLKAFDSAQASLAHYKAEVRRYCMALLSDGQKSTREPYGATDAADSLNKIAARLKKEGNFVAFVQLIEGTAHGLERGLSATTVARNFVALSDALAEAAKKEKEVHGAK